MPAFQLLPVLKHRYFDSNGDPLNGGKLWSYLAGTSTPSGTYQDSSGSVPNTNPIILNSAGEVPSDIRIAVGGGVYKFVLMDADDNVQWTVDNVSISADDVPSGWTEHSITDGQSATNLTGETVDFALYSSAIYDVEIIRGTTVLVNGVVSIQNVNGTGRVQTGGFIGGAHGVTFSVTQAALVATLRAAASAGPGDGTIKMSRRLVPA
jgi:hypothetical protein